MGTDKIKKTVLIFDDDIQLQQLLQDFFHEFGYEVVLRSNGLEAVSDIRAESPDIIILDIMMPGKDGLDVLKDIRKQNNIPVIMLTARGEDTDRILGLELGADDYISKPFNPRELLARIKAILRRSIVASPENDPGAVIKSGRLLLDRSRHLLSFGDKNVELSTTEFKMLEVLMQQPGIIFSRERLMELVYERDYEVYDRSIDVHISKLRSRIEEVGGNKERIRTMRGSGYIFEGQP